MPRNKYAVEKLIFSNPCSYEASAQDRKDGVIRMHRKITSDDVEGYASHIPKEEVKLEKDEDLVFKKGLLTKASGTTSVKLMPEVRFMCGCCASICKRYIQFSRAQNGSSIDIRCSNSVLVF